MSRVICEEVQPDYLTLLNEPDTQSKNTGLDLRVESYTEIIQICAGQVGSSGNSVGAGAGLGRGFEYFENLAKQTAVDYIDMHIYPVTGISSSDKCLAFAALLAKYKKRLVSERPGCTRWRRWSSNKSLRSTYAKLCSST